jgi:uncharacterized Zn finger protein
VARRKDIEVERFYKSCPSCGKEQSYGRIDHYRSALKNNLLCGSCGQVGKKNIKWYKGIRMSWWQKAEKNSIYRGIEFDITPELIWKIYLDQNKKCALTGIEIGWKEVGQDHTASIDRIDSSVGYVDGNVWLLHKDVNMMKQSFQLEDFIEYCKLISKNA